MRRVGDYERGECRCDGESSGGVISCCWDYSSGELSNVGRLLISSVLLAGVGAERSFISRGVFLHYSRNGNQWKGKRRRDRGDDERTVGGGRRTNERVREIDECE